MRIQTQFDENKVVLETECPEREYSPLKRDDKKDHAEKNLDTFSEHTKELKSKKTPRSIGILDVEDDGVADSVSSANKTESSNNKPGNQMANKIIAESEVKTGDNRNYQFSIVPEKIESNESKFAPQQGKNIQANGSSTNIYGVKPA